jgi:DNA-binding protein Fis
MISSSKRKTVECGNEEDVPCSAVEDILEKKIEDIVNLLGSMDKGKSTLYGDILSIVEKCLIKIALRKCDHIKTSAANFLGINRNTLHKKMEELGIKDYK